MDGIEYQNGSFEAIYHAEGRVIMVGSSLKYEYALKDHLGNTRLMFMDKNADGVIKQSILQSTNEATQENHYYAFGMAMEGNWMNTPSVLDNKYQYNGKELNNDFGLGWLDYGARQYDATLGRWHGVDPMAEKAPNMTPYRYGFNNPMRYIDPNGMFEYSDGYGTYDSKNATGSIGFSGTYQNGGDIAAKGVIMSFDKSTNSLAVVDMQYFDKDLPSKKVNAKDYKWATSAQELGYNQILFIKNVFTGGKYDEDTGEITFGNDSNQSPIPNGEYDVLDNGGDDKSKHADWFRLDAQDSKRFNDKYDDSNVTNAQGVARSGFRLHIGQTSWGCVTIAKYGTDERNKEYLLMKSIIENAGFSIVPDRRGNQVYNPTAWRKNYGVLNVQE